MAQVTVVGAIGSANGITLYLDTGEVRTLKQDDWKTREIMDKVMPRLSVNKPASVDLDAYSLHSVIEKKSGGLLRFVRKVVNGIVGRKGEPTEEISVFVDGREIPGMEKIEKQIVHAAEADAVGLTKFLQRLAVVIDDRGHEVQELLDFMKAGDLPIADDGTIIAYKKLYAQQDGWFVDPHSRKVLQRPGSFVTMAKELVDPSRRTECSTGLHIGRRGYMGRFSGDTIMLVKIAPEDVIAVPSHSPDKMRVMGYHIIARLEDELYRIINRNQPISRSEKGAELLGRVVAGDHVGIREIVEVKAAMGGEIVITGVKEERMPVDLDRVRLLHTLDSDQNLIAISPKELRETARGYREQGLVVAMSGSGGRSVVAEAALSGDYGAALSAVESTSILGQHDGVMDDDVLDTLEGEDETEILSCSNCGEEIAYVDNDPCDECIEEEEEEMFGEADHEASDEDLEGASDFHDAVVANGGTNEGMGDFHSAPETPAESPAADPAPETPEEPSSAPVKPSEPVKMQMVANNPRPERAELIGAQQRALELMDEGALSQRAIERETGVPVRKMKRLIEKGY